MNEFRSCATRRWYDHEYDNCNRYPKCTGVARDHWCGEWAHRDSGNQGLTEVERLKRRNAELEADNNLYRLRCERLKAWIVTHGGEVDATGHVSDVQMYCPRCAGKVEPIPF